MMPPPHLRRCSTFSLNAWLKEVASVSSVFWSSLGTVVSARHDAVFLCTNLPRRDLDLTMQYGTPFLRHSAGSQQMISIGSTSCAITTSLAFFSSTSVVTWLRPNLMAGGALESESLPFTFFSATAARRCFFCARVSGAHFFSRRASCSNWFLSSVAWNCARVGGTFRRCTMMRFWRCSRTRLGHLVKRVRSRLGITSPPMRKLRGVFSNSGFFLAFSTLLPPPRGAAGTFLAPVFL